MKLPPSVLDPDEADDWTTTPWHTDLAIAVCQGRVIANHGHGDGPTSHRRIADDLLNRSCTGIAGLSSGQVVAYIGADDLTV